MPTELQKKMFLPYAVFSHSMFSLNLIKCVQALELFLFGEKFCNNANIKWIVFNTVLLCPY